MLSKQISVIVITYNRPENLERVLASVAQQTGVDGKYEVIVSDDGSTDRTPELVNKFAADVSFPVKFVTHEHNGFQPSRTRNDGVRASEGEFLLLVDGDCALPPDHLRTHYEARCEGVMRGAETYVWLNEKKSSQIDVSSIEDGSFLQHVSLKDRIEMKRRAFRSIWYNLVKHPRKPRLLSGNMGLMRSDFEKVNGFDQHYVGWGHEDDDFNLRLRAAGVSIKSILGSTFPCHLWHPSVPSRPDDPQRGRNTRYFFRPIRLSNCMDGLTQRNWEDVTATVAGKKDDSWISSVMSGMPFRKVPENGEVDIIYVDCQGAFGAREFNSGADCKVLVCKDIEDQHHQLVCDADILITPSEVSTVDGDESTYVDETGNWDQIVAWIAGNEDEAVRQRAA